MDGSKENNSSSVYRLSYSLLAISLLLTAGLSLSFYKNAAEKDAVKFNGTAYRLQTEIENKINLYVTLLAGVRGYLSTTPNVNKDGFAAYVESLGLATNYPALERVGYVETVREDSSADYAERVARAGYPNVALDLRPGTGAYQLLTFVEPQSDATGKVIGYDVASDPARNAAMESAAKSGTAVMSAVVKPIVESDPGSEVITIYLPVYKSDGTSPAAQNSGTAPVGFAYTTFTPAGFVHDIEKVEAEKEVAIQIFDGQEKDTNLIAQTSASKRSIVGLPTESQSLRSELTVAGRPWVVRFNSMPSFDERSAVGWTPILFIGGVCFSFLVFGFTYHDATRRNELQKVADKLLVTQKEKEKLFEQEQNARLEAEEANRAKDEFLAIVSHELKTPLNTIAGWTTILKSEQLSPGTKDTALRKIEKNLRLQANMVEQILNFSQIMSDSIPITFTSLPASEIFDRAIAAAEGPAAEKTIMLSAVNELNGEKIYADSDKLNMALGNVLTNAVKFTPAGGMIEARAVAEGDSVLFIVRDNGSGIDQDFLPHVFEHYRQGDKPAVRAYGGLGLGLAITKHIVEIHGGTVTTSSPGLGLGSEFALTIPVSRNTNTYENHAGGS